MKSRVKAGYIYVLRHPSDPCLYKVGVTTRRPDRRLAEHNREYTEATGRIANQTGQTWEMKEYHAVPDIYWAEKVFWNETGLADIPYRGGIEVASMEWDLVQGAFERAKNAGLRPLPEPLPDYVYANMAWMNRRLANRGITLAKSVRSKSVKYTFRCSRGHEWRATPYEVAKGAGCPRCGIGVRTAEEMEQLVTPAVLYLLLHPDNPGAVRVAVASTKVEACPDASIWDDWEVHRYRNIEDPTLAISLFSELLGIPLPSRDETIEVDLNVAEQALRDLVPLMTYQLANSQRLLMGGQQSV